MAMSLRSQRVSLLRFKALLSLKRFAHSKADSSLRAPVTPQIRPVSTARQSNYDQSKWKKLDARQFGISEAMIPPHAWDVLKVLRGEGFAAYLVGGCVRDLVLNRIPKDFDVITTARLEKVKSIFQRAVIVGQHFPICKVHIKGAVVEVSSFETRSRDAKDKKMNLVSSKSGDFGKKDVRLWRDAMSRDFTINSLFLDPCGKRKIIYDYTNAMDDLKSLKLETLIRAKLSFTKDCARILRGVRIAARLGLTLSKEIEIAVHSLGSSTNSLHKNRLLMEFDYMLSYGAAEPSLHLLWRFGLVKWLLPRHRLFANLDKLVSCDQPSNSCVWVALLGFHLAVMKNTQDALVIWAFASILYEGSWKQGVCIAKQHAGCQVNFFPEIRRSSDYTSQKLAQKIRHLASLVTDSVTSLCYSVSKHKEPSRSGWPFISKKVGGDSVEIFKFLEDDLESYSIKRVGKKIDYAALQKGSLRETRFVIGKIIFETMKGGIVGESQDKEVIHDVANQNEMYNLVERKEHPVLSRKVEEKKKGADPEAKQEQEQEQEQAIRTEIVEANVNYKQKLLTEKNKVSVLSRQVEEKMKEAGTVAKQEQAIRTKIVEANVNYEQKLLTEKNKGHVLSRKVEEKKEAGPEAKQEQAIRAEIVEANVKYKQKLLTEKNKAPVLSRQVEEKKKETALEAKREQAIHTEVVEAKGKYTQKVINEKKKVHVLSRLFR